VRRTPAEVNTALAGMIFVVSFARFRASMTVFNEGGASSCLFGHWNLAAMVEGGRENAVWRED